MMSLLTALKGCIGKRCVIVHNEGEDKPHTIVGIVTDADESVLTIVTDYGVKNIIPVIHLLKVKGAG